MEELNPELKRETLEDLYIALKTEEAKFAADTKLRVPQEVIDRIKKLKGEHFLLENLNPDQWRLFYMNDLQSLYARAAAAWKLLEASVAYGGKMKHSEREKAVAIIDSYISPFSVGASTVQNMIELPSLRKP